MIRVSRKSLIAAEASPLDLRRQFEELRSLVSAGPGANKRAYGRVLSIRRTLYVAATTEEECRCISSVVRLLRRWFSDAGIGDIETLASRRSAISSTVADLDLLMSRTTAREGRFANSVDEMVMSRKRGGIRSTSVDIKLDTEARCVPGRPEFDSAVAPYSQMPQSQKGHPYPA